MTTVAQLADNCQIMLSDSGAATWAQATVEAWVLDAIREYSNHFPRIRAATITTTANDRTYDLPADFMDMIHVEYPTGEDPPQYLSRLSHKHIDFWQGSSWYDIIRHSDVGDVDEIWMSKKPAASETITYTYAAHHDHALAAGGTITIPTRHHNILMNFVYWRASQELLSAEQQSPTSSSSLLMGQLANNADRQKRAYYASIAQALQGETGVSAQVHWRNQGQADLDKIY